MASKDKQVGAIVAAAREANTHEKRLAFDRAEYEELRPWFLAFAQDRADKNHSCGVSWFRKEGIKVINAERAKAGKPPLTCKVTDNSLLTWLERYHPAIREHFRR